MIDERIIEKARKWAVGEIERHQHPSRLNFDTANKIGQELAEKLGADKNMVLLGTILMDIKLGESFNTPVRRIHTKEGAVAVKLFLEDLKVSSKMIEKAVNSIAAHHGDEKWICLEAEICANADCYRFLLPQNIIDHIKRNLERGKSFEEVIAFAHKKINEKYNILSLEVCKKELEPYYRIFNKLFESYLEKKK